MNYNYIIIGAGLSGLTTAKLLAENQCQSILILDKSRGVGGRMATRRTLETRFDHGAQFYRRTADSEYFHQKWFLEKTTDKWFENEKGEYWKSKNGMTSLAKSILASMIPNVSIELEKEICKIEYVQGKWEVTSLKNEKWTCSNLVISSPMPQTLKLLKSILNKSLLNHEKLKILEGITYTKALIGLVVCEQEIPLNDFGYLEYSDSPFFSIASMKKKGLSDLLAYSITMSADFSEENFEEEDSKTLNIIIDTIQAKFEGVKIITAELKKWRYCMPKNTYNKHSEEIAPRLYLIGDCFGGSSLLGAIRSGAHLVDSIKNQK